MRAENVFTLDEAREKFSKYIKIIFSSDNITKDKIHDVKRIITKNNTGKTRVILSYKNRRFDCTNGFKGRFICKHK